MHATGPDARVCMVLHAHLPCVRNPEEPYPLQELWLYQNILDCYVPLARSLESLRTRGIAGALTLSLSPTLITMLADEYYRRRFLDYCALLGRLAASDSITRVRGLSGALHRFTAHLSSTRECFESWGGDSISRFKKLHDQGTIGLITTAATHALLPAYRSCQPLIAAQVNEGLRIFEHHLGFRPKGFWLPEMGYHRGLDRQLLHCGVGYTMLEWHAPLRSSSPSARAIFSPLRTEAGLGVFPRDAFLCDAIWSRHGGYPGDFRYREFHHDCTWMLTDGELSEEGIARLPWGLRFYKITGTEGPKEYYRPSDADKAVDAHVEDFLGKIRARARNVSAVTGEVPLFVLAFDAELFGHWWYEGVSFLEKTILAIASSEDIELGMPDDWDGAPLDVFVPAESSWGRNGSFETWMGPDVIGTYPRIIELYRRLEACGSPDSGRAYRRAFAELLLAQSSDWIFNIAKNTFSDYSRARLEEHIGAARRIIEGLEKSVPDMQFIREREERYPFP